MAGNLRENLDPFSQHDDATLYSALRSAGLLNLASSRDASSSNLTASASTTLPSSADQSQERSNNVTLDTYIETGGSNFSLGQRYWPLVILRFCSHCERVDKLWRLRERWFGKAKSSCLTKVSFIVCQYSAILNLYRLNSSDCFHRYIIYSLVLYLLGS